MHRRRFLHCLSLPLLAALAMPAGAATSQISKLVFHVNDATPEHQDTVLRNLHNHLASVGPENLDIKVLLQGGGISMLLLPEALPRVSGLDYANAGPAFRERIDELRAQGVVFLVSGRTLAMHHIDLRRDLYGVHPRDVVPNALSQLAELQSQGYTYIKP
jgi:intracellular sulfur oxidation DsrE/DsrF family protein